MKLALISPILLIMMACGIQAQDSLLPSGAIARLGSHRFEHLEWIGNLTFTPDGSAIFAHSAKDAILWDVATGKRQQTFAIDRVDSGAMSRDGQRVVLAKSGSWVHVYDVVTRKKVLELKGAVARHCAAINSDGSVIAMAAKDVSLWDVASGVKLKSWDSSTRFGGSLRFSPDGRFLAATRPSRGEMIIFPTAGEGEPVRLDGLTGFVPWLEFSPSGDQVAGSCDLKIAEGRHDPLLRVWDPTTGKLLWAIRGSFNAGRFSPDGRSLAAGGLGNVVILDAVSGQERHRLPKTNEHIRAVAFSPDGKVLATAHGKRIRLWETEGWTEIEPGTGHTEPTNAVTFAPDGRTIATGGRDRSVIIWTWPEGRVRHKIDDIGEFRGVTHLTFTPDGGKIAAAAPTNWGDSLFVVDAASGGLLLQFGKERRIWTCEFLPGGQELVTPGGNKGELDIWESATGQHVRTIGALKEGSVVGAIQTVGDSQTVWWAGDYQQLGLRDLKTGQELRLLKGGHHHGPMNLVLSPDRGWLAVGSQVWDLSSGEMIVNGSQTPSAISPDGHLLAFLSGKGFSVWEKRTRKIIHEFGSGLSGVKQIAFSPDGTVLVAAADSDSLVWDMTGLLSTDCRSLPELGLAPNELDAAWELLASEDGWKGQQAAWKFTAGGGSAVEFLVEHVRPASAPGALRLQTLRDAFRDKDYRKRELAARELVDQGVLLKPEEVEALRRPVTYFGSGGPQLNDPKFGPPPMLFPLPDRMRQARAIAALERSGLPLAVTHLETLSRGDLGVPLTLEAKSALERVRARKR